MWTHNKFVVKLANLGNFMNSRLTIDGSLGEFLIRDGGSLDLSDVHAIFNPKLIGQL